ncbi:hypothetical protein [Bradyrhizobium sp. JYMT SZCCT0428]|uniref:hypothetical protein n=1 Tax=Bradyrhizobium sp. JYMT SZCCT0428 TaxID=2807673 RepID=UPI001BAD437E|nr:hypothetical protein [Bradyrhizobium sp. JYMT SZCCT0428]MBR1149844.1 hypothetical protein [Bradyrhizobium sp. JYMT SZCCT0428]
MKYAILALGLLATPALSATIRTKDECDTFKTYLDGCAEPMGDPPACHGGMTSGSIARRMAAIEQKYHINPEQLYAICRKVCHQKTTVSAALDKFCPRAKP